MEFRIAMRNRVVVHAFVGLKLRMEDGESRDLSRGPKPTTDFGLVGLQ